MTLPEAITALLTEYRLEEFTEFWRDEVKGDPTWDGLSWTHPRVQRFKTICETLRQATHGGGVEILTLGAKGRAAVGHESGDAEQR